MSRIIKRICAFALCVLITISSFASTLVYARDGGGHSIDVSDTDDTVFDILYNNRNTILKYLLSSVGVITGTDASYIFDVLDFVDNAFFNNSATVNRATGGDIESVTLSKSSVDTLLKSFKEYADEKTSKEDGYTLKQTLPLARMRKVFFDDYNRYTTLYNLLKECGGTAIIQPNQWVHDGSSYKYGYFFPLDFKNLAFLSAQSYYTINSKRIWNCYMWSTFNKTYCCPGYCLEFPDKAVSSIDELDVGEVTTFYFYSYDLYKEYSESYTNPFYYMNQYIIVSLNGQYSFPVFESQEAFLDYSIANGLYYTGSNYTGEGKEITIDLDTLNNILDGYYDGMYDMLQQLIADSNFTLDPEQLQELVDAVQSSYGLIADSLKEQTTILSGIGDKIDSIADYLKKIYSKVKDISFSNTVGSIFDGLSVLTDFTDFIKDFFTDTPAVIISISDAFSDISDSLSRKFPFSIPWDIEFLLEYFVATPAVPHFELPFKMEKYGIDYTIEIDFSRFEILSKLSRSILTSVFIIGLMRLTERVVKIKEGAS